MNKKLFYIVPAAIFAIFFWIAGCQKQNKEKSPLEKIYDFFPSKLDAQPNTYVMAPLSENLKEIDTGKSVSEVIFVFFPRQLIKTGEKFSYVSEILDTVLIPNSLIIPFEDGKPRKGDILLTWHYLQRAYVMDLDSLQRPVVHYIDENYDTKMAQADMPIDQFNDTLPDGTYTVLYEDSPVGHTAIFKDQFLDFYVILKQNGDSVLAKNWAGQLKVLKIKDLDILPLKTKVDTGDSVLVPYLGQFFKAQVKQIDTVHGRIWVQAYIDVFEKYEAFSVGYGNFKPLKNE